MGFLTAEELAARGRTRMDVWRKVLSEDPLLALAVTLVALSYAIAAFLDLQTKAVQDNTDQMSANTGLTQTLRGYWTTASEPKEEDQKKVAIPSDVFLGPKGIGDPSGLVSKMQAAGVVINGTPWTAGVDSSGKTTYIVKNTVLQTWLDSISKQNELLSSSTQMAQTNIQATVSRNNQALEAVTAMIKKFGEINATTTGNFRS
ncbi:MAG: hypothetical protein JWP36_2304 [Paucimonas sp.]|nr:hypothetical protein [Paucimonas sp.]